MVVSVLNWEIDRIGLREFCRRNDLDPGNVSNIANGKRKMQDKVANALGFGSVVMWKKIR